MRRPNRRAAFLLVFGLAYLLIAWSLYTTPMTPPIQRGFRWALTLMPLDGWATLWVVCGAVAIIDALLAKGRDAIGFGAAVFAPTSWSLVYLVAWAQGVPRLWMDALLYALIAAAVLIVAGMPDPSTMRSLISKLDRK